MPNCTDWDLELLRHDIIALTLCPPLDRLCDSKLEKNPEQYQAVQHIVAGSSKPAPYLVFGPPGTGTIISTCLGLHCVSRVMVRPIVQPVTHHVLCVQAKLWLWWRPLSRLRRTRPPAASWPVLPPTVLLICSARRFWSTWTIVKCFACTPAAESQNLSMKS